MQTVSSHEYHDSRWLAQFLQSMQRRLWLVHGLKLGVTFSVALLLWGFLLALWPLLPLHWIGWWGGIGLATFLIGRGAVHFYSVLSPSQISPGIQEQDLFAPALGLLFLIFCFVPSPQNTLFLYWWGGVLLSLIYFAKKVLLLNRQTQKEEIARQVEMLSSDAKGYLTALELADSLPDLDQNPYYSPDLASARIEEVRESMNQLDPVSLVPKDQLESRKRWLLVFSALFFSLLIIFPHQSIHKIRTLLFPPSHAAFFQKKHETRDIVIGDLSLTYQFPSYTQRANRIITTAMVILRPSKEPLFI